MASLGKLFILICFFLTVAAQTGKKCNCRGRRRERPTHRFGHHIVVANRNSGSISIINPTNLRVVANYTLPNNAEPMYFGLGQAKSELWVGDRANNRLVILKLSGRKIELDDFLPTPAGLFHCMNTQDIYDPYPLIWTTCDIDNETIVYDITTRRRLAVIPRPPTVARLGGFPHDTTANVDYGFVTYIGNSDKSGYVACYDAKTFKLLALRKTADDPHIAIRDNTKLGVAAQGGQVLFLSIPNLKLLARDSDQPSPHGMIITLDLRYLYVTNIAEGGKDALVTYDMRKFRRMNCPTVTTTMMVPHNPKTTVNGKRIFITHSGATSDVVSVFDISDSGCPLPSTEKLVRTGLNPFGICLLPRAARGELPDPFPFP